MNINDVVKLDRVEIVSADHVKMSVGRYCTVTREPYYVVVRALDYYSWITRRIPLMADSSDLTEEQIEFLVSNFTPAEWNHFFPIFS